MDAKESCDSMNHTSSSPDTALSPIKLAGALARESKRTAFIDALSCADTLPGLMISRMMRRTLGGSDGICGTGATADEAGAGEAEGVAAVFGSWTADWLGAGVGACANAASAASAASAIHSGFRWSCRERNICHSAGIRRISDCARCTVRVRDG